MSVCPHVPDVFVIIMVVEREVLHFIIPIGKNKWILLHELRQAFLEIFVMYETEMPRVNVVKDVQRESIKLYANFL